jgi:WD40 repeat protein
LNNNPIIEYNFTSSVNTQGKTMSSHSAAVKHMLRISATQVASGSDDGSVRFWNLSTGAFVNTYNYYGCGIQGLAVLPSGILASSAGCGALFWNTTAQITQPLTLVRTSNSINGPFKYFANNNSLVGPSNGAYFFDPVSFNLSIVNNGRGYNDIDIHPSGMIWLGGGNYLDYINITTGQVIGSITTSVGSPVRIRIMPDNVTMIVGYNTAVTQVVSLSTSTLGLSYKGHTSDIISLSVTPDSLYLVSGSTDSSIIVCAN